MIEGQEGVTWDDWVALADACEEHGVEALFRSDHYISGSDESRPVLDAWATIAGLAARTTRLELGTLVSPATFRHPSLLARNAATADEISGGRIVLGMGAGWMEREHLAYGFDFATTAKRVARFAEQLEVVHDLFREDSVDFADEYNCVFGTFDDARERKARLDEACERAGRDPATLRYSLMAPLVVGRDDREVRESARRIGSRFGRDPETVLERYSKSGPVGTLDEVVERLKEIEALGFERVMLQHLAHRDLDTVALIGRDLAPAVA